MQFFFFFFDTIINSLNIFRNGCLICILICGVGPWRWFDESMLDCCEPLETVKARGISFGKLVSLAHCAGANVEAFRTNHVSIDDFRKYVMRCSTSDDCHLISSYNRAIFKQVDLDYSNAIYGFCLQCGSILLKLP